MSDSHTCMPTTWSRLSSHTSTSVPFFFFSDTATPEIYTLSLHDALPISWPGQEGLATAIAEEADHATNFPGIGAPPDRALRIILAPTREKYDSLTRGRLPVWSEGAAFPEAGTIVLLTARPSDRPTAALRHELAHLTLRWHVVHHLPLWFEEGYAAVAAQEWDRLDALRLN